MDLLFSDSLYFGDIQCLNDCFDERKVDNGLVLYKEVVDRNDAGSSSPPNKRIYHYWQAYFGGNPTGYLLKMSSSSSPSKSMWEVLVENCDGDFIWHGCQPTPKGFIRQLKMVVYGEKYFSEEEEA